MASEGYPSTAYSLSYHVRFDETAVGLGSVSEHVAHHARSSVLVARSAAGS